MITGNLLSTMFEKSVLIVAHPDDDILWLSSVLDKVESIIFCFNDNPCNSEVGVCRKKTINEYPLANVSTFGIIEPPSWNMADWSKPVVTDYGIELIHSQEAERSYHETYDNLMDKVRGCIAGRKNVFTHNPWGEYGHEDHVLVYRVLKTLQKEFYYDLWFSNYCSNRSVNLMNRYILGLNDEYKQLPVNLTLAHEIQKIYKKNGCWTWYEDYLWFEHEYLLKEEISTEEVEILPYGHSFPVNYIKIQVEMKKRKPRRLVEFGEKMKKKLSNI